MKKSMLFFAVIMTAAIVMTAQISVAAIADFETFNIRNSNSTITSPWDADVIITENAAGNGFTAATPRGGQKVGYGTNAFDGMQVNAIETADFTKISGKVGIVPYLNLWVTDGTNYAIISSENDYRGADFSTRQEWKVFEYDSGVALDWLFDVGTGTRDGSQYLTLDSVRITLSDLSDSIILGDPSDPYPGYVGTGAPRGSYGFNVIFGDTQANYIGSYELEDLTVTVDGTVYEAANSAVPEPSTLAIWSALGGLGLLLSFRRRNKKA